ncbi:hypothetical protein DK37_03295 [Halomonas sp. SUBG004]|nr:hypothetical protein DK37_03295 [Halomonas sp. SUBG004]
MAPAPRVNWAAKGTRLLGVRAVIAESFERIHRSNLIGMGVVPLQFPEGESRESLGLTGDEEISIAGLSDLSPGGNVQVVIKIVTANVPLMPSAELIPSMSWRTTVTVVSFTTCCAR